MTRFISNSRVGLLMLTSVVFLSPFLYEGKRTTFRVDCKFLTLSIARNHHSNRFLRDFHLSTDCCLISLKILSTRPSQLLTRLDLVNRRSDTDTFNFISNFHRNNYCKLILIRIDYNYNL